jgi:hypothetical protein
MRESILASPRGASDVAVIEGKGASCYESVTVWNRPENVTVMGPADPSWNLLLAELSRLSQIVEQSTNDTDHESSSTAIPKLR